MATNINDLLEQTDVDMIEVKATFDTFEKKYQEIKKSNEQMFTNMLEINCSEEDLEAEIDSCDKYEQKYNKIRRLIECAEKIDDGGRCAVNSNAEASLAASQGMQRKFKLPQLELKKFGGNVRDWLPFWAQFKRLDEDVTIDDSDKFQYLVQSTIPGTRAREIVESYPPTADNYPKALDSLRARFGREDLLVEVYVRELLTLVMQNTMKTSILPLSSLYDKLECHLRALESLGVTTQKCASMLFPLVESCLPEDLLRAWQRTNGAMNIVNNSQPEEQEVDSARNKLKQLMNFMRSEVENEEKISLAMSGFGISTSRYNKKKISQVRENTSETSTAAGLLATNSKPEVKVSGCIFCNNNHKTTDCFKAQKLTFAEKKQILNNKKCCYNCFKPGHSARVCRLRIKCLICSKNHQPLMCPDLSQNKDTNEKPVVTMKTTENVLTSISNSPQVFLQTIVVYLSGQGIQRRARAIIDTGSQRSYLLSKSAREMKYKPIRNEKIIHTLFGGRKTEELNHNVYRIRLSSLQKDYNCSFEVLEQTTICNEVNNIQNGPWLEELHEAQIYISDIEDECSPIEILIGADVAGKLFTGNQRKLSSGIVAIETLLGWTVIGKIQNGSKSHQLAMTVTSMLVQEGSIADLWQLEAIGIKDPAETRSKAEIHEATNKHFHDTVTVRTDGRYEVCLPWIQDHPSLPDNYDLAMKRLDNTIKRLKTDHLLEEYEDTFNNWLKEEIIQECTDSDSRGGHYLPHRHVVKLNSTTKIRPVFDASAKQKGRPSLNECLDTGINLIEQIPIILLRFRIKRIGVIADIRKAFLQISLAETDRNYLKFLWRGNDGILKVYKHLRVVFGVSCSPFLLGAVIQLHLTKALENPRVGRNIIELLKNSFYVDNCVTSVNDEEELYEFMEKATSIMREAKFDLRGWEFTKQITTEHEVVSNVLGLQWNRKEDTLQINLAELKLSESDQITKRIILATANKVFDPIGYTCPVSLCPKLLLQETWKLKTSWDEEVDKEMKKKFIHWINELPYLEQIKLPRWLPNTDEKKQWSLHVFCDASQKAYATVIYVRLETSTNVRIQLLQARTRVAPLKKITIPRLELLAATIGARLCTTILAEFKRQEIKIKATFWSDSTTVIAWIKRKENWGTFVSNRVEEIRRLTTEQEWRYVPGNENPADLPSRGCNAKVLYESRWWEGPEWLYEMEQNWPTSNFSFNETEIREEKKKAIVSSTLIAVSGNDNWYYRYFSRYTKIVYMIARILRWRSSKRKSEPITPIEFEIAEQKLIKLIQGEAFMNENYKTIAFLSPFIDENGILRIKTKIADRDDERNFRYPILLPGEHVVVRRMLYDEHVKNCHAGTQTLLSILRERYWILRGRKAIRSAINKCVICKRYIKKHFETAPVPLPVDRVKDSSAFEVTGTDLAGPLYIKKGKKVWICIFTCAIYRAVHLELVSSLSTEAFLLALRRFVARRGRPSIMYSDNGTNFRGANHKFEQLNWEEIMKYTAITRMDWKFNPPTAAWWGGWWERLIGIIKKLLRKVLGKSVLNYEELSTVLCDCESIVNSRPLTYVSEDSKDLQPLTPSMFIQDIKQHSVEDCDEIDSRDATQRVVHRQKLREDLRKRFRNEYLGLLRQEFKTKYSRKIELGEVVMIENDSSRRLDWPLAKVVELMPGRDHEVRVVRLKTGHGELVRPVQRIYPLELYSPNESEISNKGLSSEIQNEKLVSDENCKTNHVEEEKKMVYTKRGRKINLPARYKM